MNPQQIIDHVQTQRDLTDSSREIKFVEELFYTGEVLNKKIEELEGLLKAKTDHKSLINHALAKFKENGEFMSVGTFVKDEQIQNKPKRKFWSYFRRHWIKTSNGKNVDMGLFVFVLAIFFGVWAGIIALFTWGHFYLWLTLFLGTISFLGLAYLDYATDEQNEK
jgi:hypothetical protein